MIGSAMVRYLLLSGRYDITVIDRYSNNLLDLMDKIKYVESDIRDIGKYSSRLQGVYCVIHLAAAVHWVPGTAEEEKEFIGTNEEASGALFAACEQYGVERVLFFSTNDVYKDSKELIDENTEVSPQNIYGHTKLAAERAALKIFSEKGLPVCIFRPSSVFGKGDKGSMKTLVSLCRRGLIPVVGVGENKKALLYLGDVMTAVEAYLFCERPLGGEIYNLSSGNFSYREIIDAIKDCYGYSPIKIRIPTFLTRGIFAGMPVLSTLSKVASTKMIDIRKIRQELKYLPVDSIRDELMDCKEYYTSDSR